VRLLLPLAAHSILYSFFNCSRDNAEFSENTNSGFNTSLSALTTFHRMPRPVEKAVSCADSLINYTSRKNIVRKHTFKNTV
jgi:hypothetical protein